MRRLRPLVALALLAGLFACKREPPASIDPAHRVAGTVTIRIAFGSEKGRLLEDSIAAFRRTHPMTTEGQEIEIEPITRAATAVMEQVLAGERSDVDVWWPASSLHADVFKQRWAAGRASKPLFDTLTPVVNSAVVIGMWEPMARALGRPDAPIGWKDIAELAGSPEGWARLGKAEWGQFSFGHTHPRYSNSGLMALVAIAQASAGKTSELTVADVTGNVEFLRRVEHRVVHYGASSALFADSMFMEGPSYLSAAVLYESDIIDRYMNPRYRERHQRIVAIYPKEGTFLADHPFSVLNLPGMTPAKRDAAERFRAFLLSRERQGIAMKRFGFRPIDPEIRLAAPFDAEHGVDPAEPKKLLSAPPPYVTQWILDWFKQVKRPVAVTLVLAPSAALGEGALGEMRSAAAQLLRDLPSEDLARAVVAGSPPRWLDDSGTAPPSRDALVSACEGLPALPRVALYDAVDAALARPLPPSTMRVVVLFSDGRDDSSGAKYDTLLRRASATPGSGAAAPRLYAIGYGADVNFAVLKELAQAGSGEYFPATPREMREFSERISEFF